FFLLLTLVVSSSCKTAQKHMPIDAPVPEAEAPKGDTARDSFLDTRPRLAKPVAQSPANQGRPGSKAKVKPGSEEVCLGIGCTIFRQDANGTLLRVSSEEVFHKGARLRFVIEPNADGFLYVFSSESSQSAEMIFPNPRLNGGLNRVEGHVQYE